MSIGPAGLQCITADHIKSQKLEALVRVADTRTRNLTEDVRLAAATRTGARAPEQFKFDEWLRAVVPGNSQLVSDVLDVRRLESHFSDSSFKERRLSSRRGRSRDRPFFLFVRQKSPCQRAKAWRLPRLQLENLASCPSKAAAASR